MGLLTGEAEGILHPAVGIFSGENAVLPDGIKQPVCLCSFSAQVPVSQDASGYFCPGMDAYIGVALGVSAAYIQVFLQCFFLMYIRSIPEHGTAAAVGAFYPDLVFVS